MENAPARIAEFLSLRPGLPTSTMLGLGTGGFGKNGLRFLRFKGPLKKPTITSQILSYDHENGGLRSLNHWEKRHDHAVGKCMGESDELFPSLGANQNSSDPVLGRVIQITGYRPFVTSAKTKNSSMAPNVNKLQFYRHFIR